MGHLPRSSLSPPPSRSDLSSSLRELTEMHEDRKAEGTDAFSGFHLYVCSAFLVKWSDELRKKDFQVRSLSLPCLSRS